MLNVIFSSESDVTAWCYYHRYIMLVHTKVHLLHLIIMLVHTKVHLLLLIIMLVHTILSGQSSQEYPPDEHPKVPLLLIIFHWGLILTVTHAPDDLDPCNTYLYVLLRCSELERVREEFKDIFELVIGSVDHCFRLQTCAHVSYTKL